MVLGFATNTLAKIRNDQAWLHGTANPQPRKHNMLYMLYQSSATAVASINEPSNLPSAVRTVALPMKPLCRIYDTYRDQEWTG